MRFNRAVDTSRSMDEAGAPHPCFDLPPATMTVKRSADAQANVATTSSAVDGSTTMRGCMPSVRSISVEARTTLCPTRDRDCSTSTLGESTAIKNAQLDLMPRLDVDDTGLGLRHRVVGSERPCQGYRYNQDRKHIEQVASYQGRCR